MNSAANAKENLQVLNVPIEDIIPNRFQPRVSFDESGLKELAASIKEHGIIQPLVLRRLQDKYEIIAGERRYKAAKMAGLMTVPAIISEMSDQKSAEVAIVENIQRRNLTAIEEAKSYKALLDKGYLTQDELAKKMGLSQSAISNKLRLLSLAEEVQNALMEGKISERHARSLLKIDDLDKQEEWLKKILDERLTVKELDKRMKENGDTFDEEDIPKINSTININAIKEKAMDIETPFHEEVKTVNKDIESNNKIEEQTQEPTKIPNTFFNYLEGEDINMSIKEDEPVVTIVPRKEEAVEEEVELLDFLAPSETPIVAPPEEETLNVDSPSKDMTKANELIANLELALKENYTITITRSEDTQKLIVNIQINKE